MNDGDVKIGYIKSFQEYNFLKKIKPFGSVVDKFNMDDKSIKYKRSLDDEDFITIATDDILKIVLVENNQTLMIYKPLRAGGVNKEGELEISDTKIWMPLVMEGDIEIYGFQLTTHNRRTREISISYYYFLQFKDEDYAIMPLSELGIFQLMDSEVVVKTALNELKLLMFDCPKLLEPLEAISAKIEDKAERKAFRKAFKKTRKENLQKFRDANPNAGRILTNFVGVYNIYYEAIAAYNQSGCN